MLRILSASPGETVPRAALTGGGTVNERAVDVQNQPAAPQDREGSGQSAVPAGGARIGYRLVASP